MIEKIQMEDALKNIMNGFASVNDTGYVYGELKNGNQAKINKEDLLHANLKTTFNGDFKDGANFPKEGHYIYSANTLSSGIINGPAGLSVLYGVIDIISRSSGLGDGLNVVVIKVYDNSRRCYTLIGSKSVGGSYIWNDWKEIYL